MKHLPTFRGARALEARGGFFRRPRARTLAVYSRSTLDSVVRCKTLAKLNAFEERGLALDMSAGTKTKLRKRH